ncbi:hypothetical protein E6H36_13110, partial [Candidatus Bathyarchaeota archaeon]
MTSITLGTSGTSTLSCTATVAHVYTVTVTAASGAVTHTFIVNYIVPAIVAANNSLGFSGVVKLSNSTSPAGLLTVTCATTSVTIGSGGSALDNCTFSSSTPNTYLVTFTGTNNTRGGAVTTSFVLTVNVANAGGFTLAANPTSVTVNANAAGLSTITATGTGSFTGTITLTPTVSPSTGLTCLAMSSINIASPGGSGTSTLSCSGVVGTYTVTVTGTASGAPTQTAPVAYTVRDFSITAGAVSPAQILAGSSGTSTITVTAGATGYSGTVNLSVSASTPAGLTCTLPPSVTFGTSPQTATLSCSATVAGDYTVTVTGTNAALSHTTAAILFHVVDFSIAAGAVSPTQIFAGSSGTSTITVTALNGLTGTVNLAVSVSTPAGLTCTLPASVTFGTSPQTATLSCSAAAAGDYTVTVTGTDATLSHTTATILFHVVDFSISAGAVSPTQILAGSSGTSTITVTALNGLTGTVNLAVSVSTPAGLTCTLPASVTFGTSPQTATLSCSAAAAADYTVTVTGTDGTLSHTTATILFHVVDFNIAAGAVSPAQILAGASGTSTITVTAVNGLTGTVNLAASASTPAGLTCTVPNVTFGTSPQTATLSCSAATAGDYTVTVTGTDGARTKTTAAILFHVVDFTIAAGAVSPTQILAGSSGTSTITVTALNGLTGTVNLAVSASTPAGLTCTLPASVTFGTSPQTATLSCSAAAAADYTVTVTGTDATLSHTTATILFHVVDFSIAAGAVSPAQILAGSSGTSTITVTALNGLTGTVNLAVSASTPAGLTCTLPASVTFGTSPQTATLSCSAANAADYTVTVTGTDGTLSHTTATILFHVVDFTIAAGAVSPTQILAGASGTSTITVTAVNGLTGAVGLSVSASTPAGLTCTLPASVTFGTSPQTATLSCSATAAGDYTVTVTGTDGARTHTTAAILFHVVDFTIAAGAVSPATILAGSSGTSTVTVTALNGLTGTVNLAVSASTPAGLTCTLPASVTFGTSPQTATLSCSASTAADYTVTVTGTDGTLSHTTATILFHVVDFSIAAGAVSPAQIFAGSSGTSTITVTALNGLTGTVNLAVSASTPAGLTCTLPASVTFGTSPQTATLSCSATAAG